MSATTKAFTFTRAVRENIFLLIGLAGGTGSGKTRSALGLAMGLSGRKKVAFIDTESGRAKHYAPKPGDKPNFETTFPFDHGELTAPFTPQRYLEAIEAASAAGYGVIVVDSFSHEWAGEGGILEAHEAVLERMAGQDYNRREACKMAAWVQPKMAHKKMVTRLLQLRSHVILCFRSEEKVEMVKQGDKWTVVPKKSLTGLDGWIPICEKHLPFELTASFLLVADKPGYPRPVKLEGEHRPFVPLDQPLSERTGEALAAWARGGQAPGRVSAPDAATGTPAALPGPSGSSEPPESDGMGSLFPDAEEAARDAALPWIVECHAVRDGDPTTYRAVKKRLDAAGLPENVRALIRGPLEAAKVRAGGR